MFESEYIKSMNCNFERIKLETAPEDKRYQYCIIRRGGITGLLPCSLRSINGDSFLYYDITSKQSLSQMFHKKTIGRQWLKDFVWNMKRISMELGRFLLDEANIIWYPDQIYQELGDNRWNFLYFPYYKGENGFRNLLEFMIEKIDYEDSVLVDCVYKIYEQYDSFGDSYLKEKIYTDIQALDEAKDGKEEGDDKETEEKAAEYEYMQDSEFSQQNENLNKNEKMLKNENLHKNSASFSGNVENQENTELAETENSSRKANGKKGLLSFLEGARKKDKETREKHRLSNHYLMENGEPMCGSMMVAEKKDFYKVVDFPGGEDYGNSENREYDATGIERDVEEGGTDENAGKTIYMENVAENTDSRKRIYDSQGKMLRVLSEDSVVLGKKTGEADVIINNSSVSRIHARIYYADGEYLIEDLNSTNGTFKNGMRLKPYEKRKLMQGDEIKLGSVTLMYG